MNTKLLIMGIILLVVMGALFLFKERIYNYLDVPSPEELQQALQSDNPTIQEEAKNIVQVAQFIDKLPFILLAIAAVFFALAFVMKGSKTPVEKTAEKQ